MKKCLVTGAGGFIGSHLVAYLKDKGHFVRGADTKLPEFRKLDIDDFLLLDLRREENCKKAVKEMDWVFNLSANMGGIGYITQVGADIMRDNVLINVNMLEACRQNNVEKIFFSSSACVYPTHLQNKTNVEPLKEEHAVPANPDNYYGWEKLFTEKLMEAYNRDYGLEIRIARLHNIYGEYCDYKSHKAKAPASLCYKVAKAIKDGKNEVEVWGDGKQTRSFLYIADCLEAIYLLMQNNFIKPINIGSDELIRIDELAKLIMEIAGKELKIKHNLNKPQGVRGRNADLTLIKKVLNWEPKIKLREGMTRLYKWIEERVNEE